MPVSAHRFRAVAIATVAALSVLSACSDATITVVKPGSQDTVPGPTIPSSMRVRHHQPFPVERCAANRAFGPIIFLTNAEWTAAAGVIEVVVAEARGYFEAMCLDVQIMPSFATENYERVAGDDAQFAAAGSFSEVADFAGRNNAKLVALSVDGRVPLDVLITRPGGPTSVRDFEGRSIGVEAALPPAVASMLANAGLAKTAQDGTIERKYTVVPLDDATAELRLAHSQLVAIAGNVSTDVPELDAAGVAHDIVDPADRRIPGSFGVIYTNATMVTQNPTVVEDFLRATARARTEAISAPDEGVETVRDFVLTQPDAVFDSAAEHTRWNAEVRRMRRSPLTIPSGIPVPALLSGELRVGIAAGLFGGVEPSAESLVDIRPIISLFRSDRTLIWPSEGGS